MKTTHCFYTQDAVNLGRARTRCPRCGAQLQSGRPNDAHYIAPPVVLAAAGRHVPDTTDFDLPTMLGEPEPPV